MNAPIVRAAGGVVWRIAPDAGEDAGARIEVVLVHRPRYDDWSLPKGKADGDEPDERTALREVEEETGLVCELGAELPSTTYTDRNGRTKVVRYWAMQVIRAGPFVPDDEVDQLAWAPITEAAGRLTYARDRAVLAALHPE